MNKILVMIQENQFSKRQIVALEALLKSRYQEHVSDEKTTVVWAVIPEGQAYTDYQPSQSSIITMACPESFAQDKREALLVGCAEEWVGITGQHLDQVMMSLLEQPSFDALEKSNQARLSTMGKLRMGSHIAKHALSSKLRGSPLSFPLNIK